MTEGKIHTDDKIYQIIRHTLFLLFAIPLFPLVLLLILSWADNLYEFEDILKGVYYYRFK